MNEKIMNMLNDVKIECKNCNDCVGCPFFIEYGCALKNIPQEWCIEKLKGETKMKVKGEFLQCKRVGESDEVEMIVNCTTGFWARALYRLMDTLRKERREAYETLMSQLIEDDLDPEEIEFIQAWAGGKKNDKRRNL